METNAENIFTFKDGTTVPIQFVKFTFITRVRSAAQKKALSEHGEPAKPTFVVTAAGGSEYEQEHSEESVQRDEHKDDEDLQEAWAKYKATKLAVDLDVHQQTCRAYAIKGVDAEPPEEWVEDQEYWGLEVPDDARDRKFAWLLDVSTGWDEILDLVLAIQDINPIEEVASAVEDGFRDSMGEGVEEADAGADTAEAEGSGGG